MGALRVGLIGAGSFLSRSFAELFARHPGVGEVYVADLDLGRAEALVGKWGFAGACRTLEELLAIGVDAVGIFTGRHTHAPLAVKAMEAGCHVYTAVPAAVSLEEMRQVVETSRRTRRIFMTGETSYYYPEIVYCREEFATGRWGKFVYAEAQYVHDWATWGPHFKSTHGDEWARYAAIPPMYYATHSFSMPLSVTGARVTHVSAQGYVDVEGEPAGSSGGPHGFGKGRNPWDNPFSNQVTLGRTSDGGSVRIGEFRRAGWFARRMGREVMMPQFYCTDACFEENAVSTVLTGRPPRAKKEVEAAYVHEGWDVDLGPWVDGPYFESPKAGDAGDAGRFMCLAKAHAAHRLPAEYRGIKNGHSGSHLFLIDDFVRCATDGSLPPTNAWASANWCAPGLVAHESALRGGELLEVPDYGSPPGDWAVMKVPEREDAGLRPTLPGR